MTSTVWGIDMRDSIHDTLPASVVKKALDVTVWSAGPATANICGCIGPQNGQPLCPCQMRNVKVVEVEDLGPVK